MDRPGQPPTALPSTPQSARATVTGTPKVLTHRALKGAFRRNEQYVLNAVRLLNEAHLLKNLPWTHKTKLQQGPVQSLTTLPLPLTANKSVALTPNLLTITAMSTRDAYLAFLRPSIIHILRAAGFHAARPAALDSLVDITARYLEILAVRTAESAALTGNTTIPTITDARNALQYVGAIKPEMGPAEEQLYGDDDLRGVNSLISWFDGPQAGEIRRVAGLEPDGTALPGEDVVKEDYLTALKKKHSKTGDEERFRGTMLGMDLPPRRRIIEGGGPTSLAAWRAKQMGEELVEDQEDTESG